MTLLDAYALIAFLAGGPAAGDVRSILREGDAAVTTTNLAESLDVSRRVYGLPIERAMEVMEPLLDGTLVTVPLTADVAVRAASIRAKHYHRARRPISLADAVLLAAATDAGGVGPGNGDAHRIATSDPDVLAIAREERIATAALPQQG